MPQMYQGESLCVKTAVQANNRKLTVDLFIPSQYVNLTRSLDSVRTSSTDFNQTERKIKEIKVYMAAQKQGAVEELVVKIITTQITSAAFPSSEVTPGRISSPQL